MVAVEIKRKFNVTGSILGSCELYVHDKVSRLHNSNFTRVIYYDIYNDLLYIKVGYDVVSYF